MLKYSTGHVAFTNEIKDTIGTNTSKQFYAKWYLYPQIHKEDIESEVS